MKLLILKGYCAYKPATDIKDWGLNHIGYIEEFTGFRLIIKL